MKPKLVLQKGAQSSEWGTPDEVVNFAKDALGIERFDCDMATHKRWMGGAIGALPRDCYTLERPCPKELPRSKYSRVWCNPPAGVEAVRSFWGTWCEALTHSAQGAFLIYQIDHWRSLPPPPVNTWCLIWPKRLKFVGASCQANFSSVLVLTAPPEIGHGNVVEWGPEFSDGY